MSLTIRNAIARRAESQMRPFLGRPKGKTFFRTTSEPGMLLKTEVREIGIPPEPDKLLKRQ